MRALAAVVAIIAVSLTSACGAGAPSPRDVAAVGGAVIATVPLRDYGTDVVVTPDGARVYVALRAGRVIVVDAGGSHATSEITVDGQPYALALTPGGRRAYVADFLGEAVSVIDTARGAVTARIPVGTLKRPSMQPSVAVSRDGLHAYVADTSRDHLLAIGTVANQVEKDLFLDIHPSGVGVSPDGHVIYVAGCKLTCTDGTILVIDAATYAIAARIPLRTAPSALAVTPDGRRAYVANGRDASVSAVDLRTQGVSTIAVGPDPAAIAVDPRGGWVYATSFQAGRLYAISTLTNEVGGTAPVGAGPRAIAIAPDGRRAYVTHSASVLSIVDLARVHP